MNEKGLKQLAAKVDELIAKIDAVLDLLQPPEPAPEPAAAPKKKKATKTGAK